MDDGQNKHRKLSSLRRSDELENGKGNRLVFDDDFEGGNMKRVVHMYVPRVGNE